MENVSDEILAERAAAREVDRINHPHIDVDDYVQIADSQPPLSEEAKALKHKLSTLFSSEKSDWETPQWFFDALNREFHFDVDVCADMQNRKTHKFFSIHQDAFRLQWHGTCWMNPPYSRGIERWLEKAKLSALQLGSTVVCLVPSRTDTNWWFDHAIYGEVRFLKGRLKFEGAPTSAPFPSALIIYRPGLPQSTSYWRYDPDLEAGIQIG